jgi:dienelactone hydrolase
LSQLLSQYERWEFADSGITHAIYSHGSGADVVIIHELPGMTEACLQLGIDVAKKFRVHLPLLFGAPGVASSWRNVAQICIQREIYLLAAKKTSPVVAWLRALCRKLKSESRRPGVGVIGMCVTGGFALTLVADESVLAPVVAQPSLPRGFWNKSVLGLSEAETADVKARTERLGAKCVLGLRYSCDRTCPAERMDSIRQLIGSAFDYEEIPGNRHATLTVHRHPRALERTIAFLSERLGA